MTEIISPENYVMPFGKYKQMRAIDVAELYQVDKNGNDKPVGLHYLRWLVLQDWFQHKYIISEIIKTSESCMSDLEEEEPKKEKKEKRRRRKMIKKKRNQRHAKI